jgi:hypothetical protein
MTCVRSSLRTRSWTEEADNPTLWPMSA